MKLLGAEKGRAKIEGDLWGLCRYKGLGPGRCPRGTVLEGGLGAEEPAGLVRCGTVLGSLM
jgi:hypothetical protein